MIYRDQREREMDRLRMWKTVRENLGFTKGGIGCCGSPWCCRTLSPSMHTTRGEVQFVGNLVGEGSPTQICDIPVPEMLTVLAAEKKAKEKGSKTLMRWLTEEKVEMTEEEENEGIGECCCVCLGKNKGAAFIPCGHTFCRSCARELWIGRRSCPLCNRPILEILDIF